MDESLYIRVRGRVQGPFDREKLQQLARRGQLSRIHEVSSDGASWRKASEYPELFSSSQAVVEGGKKEARDGGASTATASSPTAPAEPQWYYGRNGGQHGPLRFLELQRFAALGQLSPTDAVWCEGMQEWTMAQSVPGLFAAQPASETAPYKQESRVEEEQTSPTKLSGHLVRSAADAQVWVMFIAIVGYIFAGLMIAGGVVLMVGIADDNLNAGYIGTVLMWFLYAGVLVTGSVLLNRYYGAVTWFTQSRTEARLDVALRRLKSFWVFVSIVLIVITVNIIIGAILFFSAVASFTDLLT